MYAELSLIAKTKVCGDCKLNKPASDFSKDKGKYDGLCWHCKVCRKKYRQQPHVRSQTSIYNKAERKKDPEKTKERDRKYTLSRYWGMTPEEFEKLLNDPGRKCKICKRPERSSEKKPLVIDHCHTSGRIRGLLCDDCNRGIGLLKDSPDILQNALDYLVQGLETQDKKPA